MSPSLMQILLRWFLCLCLLVNANFTAAVAQTSASPLKFAVRSITTPTWEFRGVVQALNLNDQIFDTYLTRSEYQNAERQLLNEFASAQSEFLSGSLDRAAELFELVASRRQERSWATAAHQAMVFSLFRRAQLAEPEQQKIWLRSAASFSPNSEPNKDLFPPPLVDAFKHVKSELANEQVPWQPAAHLEYEYLILDSRKIPLRLNDKINLAPGTHRVELVGAARAPLTLVAEPEQILAWNPQPGSVWVHGTCEQPQLHSFLHKERSVVAVFNSECWREFRYGKLLPTGDAVPIPAATAVSTALSTKLIAGPSTTLPTKHATNNSDNLDLRSHSQADTGLEQGFTPTPLTPETDLARELQTNSIEERKWYQKSWVWWVGGAVVLGGLAALTYSSSTAKGGGSIIERPIHR